ncbi:hypothetical protein U5801_23195 [Lamprobacter modestohalophilus]|nr:hypothetical protein [Lamprobacter modestohalophilus]
MTKWIATSSRCSQCTPASVAMNAANAAGASSGASAERDQSRKVLRGQPIAAAAWRSL